MSIHHAVTLTLIVTANIYHQQRQSLMVLLVHDVADIFLYSAKVAVYNKRTFLADILFACFAMVFFVSRLAAFPVYCVLPAWRYLVQFDSLILIIPVFLTVLLALHVLWGRLIAKMVLAFIDPNQTVDKDCRSDDDEIEVVLKPSASPNDYYKQKAA